MAKLTAPTLNESMKLIAHNLIHSMELTDIFYGTVTKDKPLEITIQQKIVLTEEFLILSNMVKDHEVDITVSMETVKDNYLDENAMNHTHLGTTLAGNLGAPIGGETYYTMNFDTTHHHDIKGRKKIMFHYGLKSGEKVILLRMQGGQKYYVMDRIDVPPTEGEWI